MNQSNLWAFHQLILPYLSSVPKFPLGVVPSKKLSIQIGEGSRVPPEADGWLKMFPI